MQSRLEAKHQGEELLVGELDPAIPVGVKLLEGIGQSLEEWDGQSLCTQQV